MLRNLGKYGTVNASLNTELPGGKYNENYLDRIIEEAGEIGKVPWCACEWHEMVAADILGYERETYEETRIRRGGK